MDSFEAGDIGSTSEGNHGFIQTHAVDCQSTGFTESTKSLAPEIDSLPLGKDLNKAQRADVKELLSQYQDIFSLPGSKIGRTSKVQHTIDVGSNPPIRQKARRIPL